MSDHLTVHYDYSPAEHVQALEETPYRRLLKKWWVPGSIAFIAVLFTVGASSRGLFGEPLSNMLWVIAFSVLPMLAMMLATPAIMRRVDIARYRRARAEDASATETRLVGREGFSRAEGSQPIPWSMITRVVESDNFFLFYDVSSEIPDYVPKRVLAASDLTFLHTLLRQQFQVRPGDLKLLPG